MKKEDYQKLNYYLNGCFKKLEENDSFLLRNIHPLGKLSDNYILLTDNYQLDYYAEENNLTFNDVYLLAREIIESIDNSYLKYYDKMLDNGQLDFSYDFEYPTSQFCWNYDNDTRLININRTFNYIDVTTLIHEFIHYMNTIDMPLSKNRYLLSEAISIYFEEYAKLYLLNKGVSKEELFFNKRIIYTKKAASNFNWYSLIFLAYEKYGNIDENTYQLLNKYICKITKEEFDEECSKALSFCEKIHKEYELEYKTNSNAINMDDFEEKLFKHLITFVNEAYRYIFGTYIAYYALEHSTKEKMTYLCNHINEYPYSMMNVFDILEAADIDVDELDISIIENVLEKNNTKRKIL